MTVTASIFFDLPVERISAELESSFFSSLKTGNNTFKKTQSGRFTEIDTAVAQLLAETAVREPAVLDIGISSGSTALELKARLEQEGLSPHLTGTDQSFEAWLVPGPHGSQALVQPDGHILQFEVFGRALRAWDRRLDRFTGRSLLNAALRRAFQRASANLSDVAGGRRVKLVSPRLSQSQDITLREDNILLPNPEFAGKFDLVRAANILNRDYFSETQLTAGLKNVRSYLKGPGSLLLLVRTDKRTETNNGSLYIVGGSGGLELVRRFGTGSEVEELLQLM